MRYAEHNADPYQEPGTKKKLIETCDAYASLSV